MNPTEMVAPQITTIGEAMSVLTPASRGALRDVRGFERGVGGAEANVAVALARLGHRSGWSGALGDDELGASIREFLRAEGVDTLRTWTDSGAPTGLYIKEFRARESLRVHYYRAGSAASRMQSEDLDWLLSGHAVHLTGITAVLSEGCLGCVECIAEEANWRGVDVCFDANVRYGLMGGRDPVRTLGPFLRMADLIFLSEEEADLLLEARDPQGVALAVQGMRAHTVVVHGAHQAFAVRRPSGAPEAEVSEAATSVVGVVDPVGAGDAFVAGFLAGWLRGFGTPGCLELANACGGCSASLPGDAESMPYAEDVAEELGREVGSER